MDQFRLAIELVSTAVFAALASSIGADEVYYRPVSKQFSSKHD
jgi:hypothetical protein